MIVDRDRPAHIVVLHRMSRDMDFADEARIEGVEPGCGIAPEVERRHLDIVDVEQQAAAAAPREFVKKVDLVPVVARIGEVPRRILDQDRTRQPVLHAADLGHEMVERRVAIGDGQQVGEFVVRPVAPAQMVRKPSRGA